MCIGFACTCVCVRVSDLRVNSCELPRGYWELNPDPLEEHLAFLTAISPALGPRILISSPYKVEEALSVGNSQGQSLCPLLCVVFASQTLMFSEHIPPTLQLPPCPPWAEEGGSTSLLCNFFKWALPSRRSVPGRFPPHLL
jgi:hypothetical protein